MSDNSGGGVALDSQLDERATRRNMEMDIDRRAARQRTIRYDTAPRYDLDISCIVLHIHTSRLSRGGVTVTTHLHDCSAAVNKQIE